MPLSGFYNLWPHNELSAIYPFGDHDFGRGSSCDSGYMNNLSESYNF